MNNKTAQQFQNPKPEPLSSYEKELEEFKNQNLYRKLRVLEDRTAVRVFYENRELTVFCGNDYLGLSHDARVIKALQQAAETHGVGSGASRLISGTSERHIKLEEKIARFKNTESALVYTAGYLANLGVLTALAGEKDRIVMDKLCHASLIDGARLSGAEIRVFPHLNYKRCEEIFQTPKRGQTQKGPFGSDPFWSGTGKTFLVSDTVFSMDGDLADIEKLIELKKKYKAFLILDDAHGTGVFGKRGSGVTEGFEPQIDMITGTLSKAIGAVGGYAACSKTLKEYLINTSRSFIFATSLPSSLCAAAEASLHIIEEEPALRQKLWDHVKLLYQGLKDLKIPVPETLSPIIPILIGSEKEAVRISEALLEKGFLVPAIRTPTVAKGKARLRVTLSAKHEKKDINQFLQCLAKILKNTEAR